MSEQQPRPWTNRILRKFAPLAFRLGLAAAAAVGPVSTAYSESKPAPTEEIRKENRQEFQGELTLGMVKGIWGGSETITYKEKPKEILARMEEMLKSQQVDLVLTPEYSFRTRSNDEYMISLDRTEDGYEINKSSNSQYAAYLQEMQGIAKQYRTDIFAATFNLASSQRQGQMDPFIKTSNENALLHINSEGKIVGIKSKNGLEPEGDFTVRRDGREYRMLPMICGEIWTDAVLNEEKSAEQKQNIYNKTIPDWVKPGNFDVFLHPQEQRDVNFDVLARRIQGLPIDDSQSAYLESAANGFDGYYSDFRPYLKIGAPIITTDLGIGAAFVEDGRAMGTYIDTSKFAVAKIRGVK